MIFWLCFDWLLSLDRIAIFHALPLLSVFSEEMAGHCCYGHFQKSDINEKGWYSEARRSKLPMCIGIHPFDWDLCLTENIIVPSVSFDNCSKCQDHYSAMLHNRLALPSLAEAMEENRAADQNGFWPLRPGILPLTASADCPFWKTSSHKFGDTFQSVGISRRIECRCLAEWDSANIGTPSFWWRTYALPGIYSHFVRTFLLFCCSRFFCVFRNLCCSSRFIRFFPFTSISRCVSTHRIMQSFPFWAQR